MCEELEKEWWEGKAEGKAEGRIETLIVCTMRMLAKGFQIREISDLTGEEEENVEQVARAINTLNSSDPQIIYEHMMAETSKNPHKQ